MPGTTRQYLVVTFLEWIGFFIMIDGFLDDVFYLTISGALMLGFGVIWGIVLYAKKKHPHFNNRCNP